MAPNPIELRPSFASPDDAQIIQECALHISHSLDSNLYVSPLGRAGFSGARLYKVHLYGGRLFVVKIDDLESIKREAEAVDTIQPFLSVNVMSRDPVVHGRDGALVYPFAGGGNVRSATEVKELHEVAFDDGATDAKLIDAIREAFEPLAECERKEPHDVSFLHEYDRYLRGFKGNDTLKAVLGPDFEKPDFRFLEADCVNPRLFLDDPRFKLATRLTCGPIHGDFHPKNVMVDKYWHTHVIDYAWANICAHRLKDFVLMECSLRFNIFPRSINFELHRLVDEVMLNYDGPDQIAHLTKSSPTAEAYSRMAGLVRQIRSMATPFMAASSQHGFNEYLASQFLILHGLLRYPDYHSPATVRVLGMIAKRLNESWHPTIDRPA